MEADFSKKQRRFNTVTLLLSPGETYYNGENVEEKQKRFISGLMFPKIRNDQLHNACSCI
jgi:hypothetical protein